MTACTLHLHEWQTGCARIVVGLAMLLMTLASAQAQDSACADRDDVLGTSRILHVDTSRLRVGRKHFPDTLALNDKEVVLTFDDGPFPPTTGKILDILKAECVRATFFMVGRMAAAAPAIAERVRAEGHTVAYHTYSHPLLTRLHPDRAMAEIERGIAAVNAAAYGAAGKQPEPVLFRFPGFASSPALLARVAAHGFVVFGADLWASDWNRMTPQAELRQVMGRLAKSGGGILLMHDTKRQTAAMLPALLRRLKTQGFRIVHIVPAGP